MLAQYKDTHYLNYYRITHYTIKEPKVISKQIFG
jgi:hypothetical protein